MDETADFREAERLKQVLSNLEIAISHGDDGRYTAYTTTEPLFCFERSSVNELHALILDTLTSYVENFYNIRGVKVEISDTPEERPSIPVERLVPISKVRPFVQPRPEQEKQLEPA